ncbi:DUF421 domain-containing protein [Niallia sp. 03133]|uniref:DUF421 domain-containing protein n=1 Tax=Niallia sp. 03133 TaxID=3458060 RepID=UPI004043981F
MLYGLIILKLVIGLIALIVVMRLLGKKEMSEVTPFDFIYTLILGGILEESLYDEKISILHILCAITVWGILIYIVEMLVQKMDKMKKPLKGEPAELLANGKLNMDELKKNQIEMEQLRSMLRGKDIFSIKDANYVLLETNGMLSVIGSADSKPSPSFMVMDEGIMKEHGLKKIGKSKAWLQDQLIKRNVKAKDVFYAEWSEKNGLYFICYDKKE